MTVGRKSDWEAAQDTPKVAADFVGVRIALSPPAADYGPLVLRGVFQLPMVMAAEIDEHPHRALVVALASTHGTSTVAPFRHRVFFPDDIQRMGAAVRGHFQVDLIDPGEAVPAEPHWLTVSLGVHLSNVVGFMGRPSVPR